MPACAGKYTFLRSTKLVSVRSLQNRAAALSYRHSLSKCPFFKKDRLISLSHNPVLADRFSGPPLFLSIYVYPCAKSSFFIRFFFGRVYSIPAEVGRKSHKFAKIYVIFTLSVDRWEMRIIMNATEQSMIEARKSSVAPFFNAAGTAGGERAFRRRVSVFPDGYAWAGARTSAGLSLLQKSGELSDIRPLFEVSCHEQYLLCS